MLRNYAANYKKNKIPQTRDLMTFGDADQIDGWAKDAVEALYCAEVLNGSGGAFNPKDTATRADGSVYKNFIRLLPAAAIKFYIRTL